MMGITGASSCLNIGSSRRSSSPALPKTGSSASLPNLFTPDRAPLQKGAIPIPRSPIDAICDDEPNEQPVDFSQKYPVEGGFNGFPMYAETDLDQPTDYSLRYAEDDVDLDDSDSSSSPAKGEVTEFVQDTVKTYCTEDTPYVTPFNVSNSTSMSDLRIDDGKVQRKKDEEEEKLGLNEKVIIDEIKSEYNIGIMSPDKPINYCEEGTPQGYLSRAPSFGSLNSIIDPPKELEDPPQQEQQQQQPKEIRLKAVKFEKVVNYAEETPLMFSRSSSLASLDSIEQHSIHDDRSSVVSDFSRLTSGLVSPSELPDSPTQTVPPSPRVRKTVIEYHRLPPVPSTAGARPKRELDLRIAVQSSGGIFEDSVKKFTLEKMPNHFSTATSLSSLTIDDNDEVDSKHKGVAKINNSANSDQVVVEGGNELSGSSDDEEILKACISTGIQFNTSSSSNNEPKSPRSSPVSIPECSLPVPAVSPEVSSPTINIAVPKVDIANDSVRTYCTEDTPAFLSHAGSHSDLSAISASLQKSDHKNMSDDDDDGNLLAECIQSGMASVSEAGSPIKGGQDNKVSHLTGEVKSKDETMSGSRSLENSPDSKADQLDYPLSPNEPAKYKLSSSFCSSLSDVSDDSLLKDCILSGMPKAHHLEDNGGPPFSRPPNDFKEENLTEEDDEEDLLQQCIADGMNVKMSPKKQSSGSEKSFGADNSADYRKERREKTLSELFEGSEEDDEDVLVECITAGMQNVKFTESNSTNSPRIPSPVITQNGYQQYQNKDAIPNFKASSPKRRLFQRANGNNNGGENNSHLNTMVKTDVAADYVRSYFTEDTPFLSHAGSNSDLSVLSLPLTENQEPKSLESHLSSDINSNISEASDGEDGEYEEDDDDKKLLEECIQAGIMLKAASSSDSGLSHVRALGNDLRGPATTIGRRRCKIDLNISLETNTSESDATEDEHSLLNQCILEGMRKTATAPTSPRSCRPPRDTSFELSRADQALLKQCILSGMPKHKGTPLSRSASASRDSAEISETDRILLQQCILEGMRRNRPSSVPRNFNSSANGMANSNNGQYRVSAPNRVVVRQSPREQFVQRNYSLMQQAMDSGQQPDHACCIHCPRYNPRQLLGRALNFNHPRTRRRNKVHEREPIRERREGVDKSQEWIL